MSERVETPDRAYLSPYDMNRGSLDFCRDGIETGLSRLGFDAEDIFDYGDSDNSLSDDSIEVLDIFARFYDLGGTESRLYEMYDAYFDRLADWAGFSSIYAAVAAGKQLREDERREMIEASKPQLIQPRRVSDYA